MPQPATSITGSSGDERVESPLPTNEAMPAVPEENPTRMHKDAAFSQLIKAHPLHVDTKPPKRKSCRMIESSLGDTLYNRWVYERSKLRCKEGIESFPRVRPSKKQLKKFLMQKDWDSKTLGEAILADWSPTRPVRGTNTGRLQLQSLIKKQRWPGLSAFTSEKGRGVTATRPFRHGEVVCDYHGTLLTHEEGIKRHANIAEGESGYMFFFRMPNTGERYCINAQDVPCPCHTDKPSTIGRLLNHSRKTKNVNIKPHCEVLDQPTVVFRALRDIGPGEELLFDYGVRKSSFQCEGSDLDWLDK
ncbi:PREDICTED: N-lysine methyltransferase SETD8-A-like [Priapulus caudatus]|uniref:N-lysine methyltransferase SETD8-A-like n=1 Tax=Priapulus caudatus TaxID=37621 RepID=A0ABM1F3S9_PRICU|nr:PREDICTED: N-lysine methyltransferase SETD8-A-like [Priapulus caudatus]